MSSDELVRLVDESGFVFHGLVVRASADVELGPAAAGKTAAVTVEEVLYGTDVMRDLVGRTVVVVSDTAADLQRAGEAERPPGAERPAEPERPAGYVFFTNCVSLGNPVVLREVGRRDATSESLSETAEAVRIVEERPLAERVAAADMIVTGEVASSSPVGEPGPPRSEHDPDWWISRVNADQVVKGRNTRKRFDVLWANSLDVVWYRSPKLHQGVSGIFLLHSRIEDVALSDVALPEVSATLYYATHPLDWLPTERLPDVQRLVGDGAGERSNG